MERGRQPTGQDVPRGQSSGRACLFIALMQIIFQVKLVPWSNCC